MAILLLIYVVAGYWAVPRTIWANKTIIYSDWTRVFILKCVYAFFLGWILIPWALLNRR